MASFLWGNVYYQDIFAGILREERGGRMIFEYGAEYLNAGHPLISYRLVGILLGNTDMHFKNFAMFHTSAGVGISSPPPINWMSSNTSPG